MQSPIPAMHPRFLLQPHASTHAPHSVPYAFSTPYIPSAPAYSQGGGRVYYYSYTYSYYTEKSDT